MNTFGENFVRLLHTPTGVMHLVASLVISACAMAVFGAVFVNFLACSRRQDVKRERKSFVATGSMIFFFCCLYGLIRFRVGVVPVANAALQTVMMAAGLAVIVCGCVVNIMGRLHLGRNWANQATIYDDQKLVVSGVYRLVRHPLYASLIWMFYGAALVYANIAGFLANSLIFVPFMYYRARLEEALLEKEFKDYAAYKQRTGMFFFKPFQGGSKK